MFVTLTILCKAAEYYVRPTDPTSVPCPGQPCFTLNYYASHSNYYFKSNATFTFLTGLHWVDKPVLFKEVKNVSLYSYSSSSRMDVRLVSNFTSKNLCNIESTTIHCSPVLSFENVDEIFFQGITVLSTIPGTPAVILNHAANVHFQLNSFTCLHSNELPGSGLLVLNTSSIVVHSTNITNCSNGISLIFSEYISIFNLTVKHHSKNGITLNSTWHTSLSNVTAVNNSVIGIAVERSRNTTISNTYCFQSGEDGIVLVSSSNTMLSNVVVHSSGIFGMYVGWSNFTTIAKSTFSQSKQDGICLEEPWFVTISNTTANYNNQAGIFMHGAISVNITGSNTSYNFNGIVIYSTFNVSVSYIEAINSSGNSSHALGSGMWVMYSDFLYISNVKIVNSTLDGIAVGATNNTVIESTFVKQSYFSGILLDGCKNNIIRNVTVLCSYMDIELRSSVDNYISSATVSSSEVSRGLTIFFSNNTRIEDMNFLSLTNSTYHPSPSILLPRMFPDSVFIQSSVNATMTLNQRGLQRGVTIYNSKNIIIQDSSFIWMKLLTFSSDTASLSSVIMLYYSLLHISNCTFRGNKMTAVKLFSSNLTLVGDTDFTNNTAKSGTGFILSKDSSVRLSENSHTTFTSNHATNTGGVFYVATNFHYNADHISNPASVIIESTLCFLFVEGDRSQPLLTFYNNTAGYGGDLVYGGQIAYGWDGDWNCLLGFKNTSHILQPNNMSLISSPPSRVCLCSAAGVPDCFNILDSQTFSIYPGQTISVSAVVTGQGFGTVAGSVHAQFLKLPPTYHRPQLNSWQYTQGVVQYQCKTLSFTISSTREDSSCVLVLTADDSDVSSIPSRERVNETIELWRSTFYDKTKVDDLVFTKEIFEYPVYINITLLPCPLGFQLTNNPPHRCVCTDLLHTLPGVKCHIQEQVITRDGSVWIGVTEENGSVSVIMSGYCPLGYCCSERLNISLSDANTQCNFQRAGILCGGCRPGLSLTLGSSQCELCSNKYLALLLPFCLAGIVLVFFIKMLDLTVSQGTINALILYANIVQANKSFFLSDATTPLTIFIAWLNLDIGIKTCFFSGQTTYTNTWLQFVFPVYIWTIAGVIIVVAKYSDRVAKLMGNNSVPVLATLFLLSYAKLLGAIITALSVRFVYTSHGMRAVWAADGNLDYLGHKHTPLFAVALASLLFLWLPYTLLLFLGHWLQRCNHHVITKCLLKLKPFLDAHYAPFKGNHRYWFGALLLARATILLISVLVDNVGATVYSISALSILLTYLGLVVYHNTLVLMFETSFSVNLGMLAQTRLLTAVHRGGENIVADILIGIAFVQFLGLVSYKLFTVLKLKQKLRGCLGKRRLSSLEEEDWENWEQAALLREVESENGDEDVLLSPVMDNMAPTYGY